MTRKFFFKCTWKSKIVADFSPYLYLEGLNNGKPITQLSIELNVDYKLFTDLNNAATRSQYNGSAFSDQTW